MYQILRENGFAVAVIANKADKLSRNQRQQALRLIAKELELPPEELVVFSAVSREGKDRLQQLVEAYLRQG